jgi:hypothetical protein
MVASAYAQVLTVQMKMAGSVELSETTRRHAPKKTESSETPLSEPQLWQELIHSKIVYILFIIFL